MSEAGLPGFTGGSWFSLHAPANTPKPIIERIRTEVVAALKTPELAQAYIDKDVMPSTSTAAELTQLMQAETAKWQRVAAKIGLVPE
jgi:tripartite-type tricarboxylate transporter receptor subunit TctC